MSDNPRTEAAAIAQREKLAAAYARVFDPSFPEGQVVLDDLLRAAGLLEDAWNGEGEPTAAVWRDGRRSLGTYLLNRLCWSPAELMLLRRRQAMEQVYGFDAAGAPS